jgi:UDP-N-acetylglucosamine transferase subunit ALG13
VTTLLVASTGGHLKQLHQLHRRLEGVDGPFRWATFDTPQSRSLLEGERVDFVPFVGGRDPANVARNFRHARRILGEGVGAIVSTGSSVALPYFVLGRARRIPCVYIESAARSDGPSLTGKLIGRVPGVARFAQYRTWASRRWAYGGSVFDAYEAEEATGGLSHRIRSVVVTLGSYRGFQFPRLIERLLQILPTEVEVLWQTGETDVGRFGIEGREAIPERELSEAMREADVVVAHAGVGAALAALEVGKCPVLVPRRFSKEEHIDDHQIQIATELASRGLALSVEADALELSALEGAAAAKIGRVDQPPRFDTRLAP